MRGADRLARIQTGSVERVRSPTRYPSSSHLAGGTSSVQSKRVLGQSSSTLTLERSGGATSCTAIFGSVAEWCLPFQPPSGAAMLLQTQSASILLQLKVPQTDSRHKHSGSPSYTKPQRRPCSYSNRFRQHSATGAVQRQATTRPQSGHDTHLPRAGPGDEAPDYTAVDSRLLNRAVMGLFRSRMVQAIQEDSPLSGCDLPGTLHIQQHALYLLYCWTSTCAQRQVYSMCCCRIIHQYV